VHIGLLKRSAVERPAPALTGSTDKRRPGTLRRCVETAALIDQTARIAESCKSDLSYVCRCAVTEHRGYRPIRLDRQGVQRTGCSTVLAVGGNFARAAESTDIGRA